MRLTTVLLPVLFVGACAAIATLAGDGDRRAWRLEQRQGTVRGVEIEVMESAPPQFALALDVDMPTPGWALETDSVTRPDADGRIVVLATGSGPDGMVAQVITATPLRVRLGNLTAGDYTVDVRVRRGAGSYRSEGCFLFVASARDE